MDMVQKHYIKTKMTKLVLIFAFLIINYGVHKVKGPVISHMVLAWIIT